MPRDRKAGLEAERLLWRAGFGPRAGDVARFSRMGRSRAVETLLRGGGPQLIGPQATVDDAPLDPVNVYGHDVLWWLDRCVRTGQPLVERMTLNWHDHFATSNDKVGNVKLMMGQYWTIRRYALGQFRTLALKMLHDGAMQLWLDLAGSEKGQPNENFARELMELFTLGVNNGYTERDIREAARALTGFTFNYEQKTFDFDPEAHDSGYKTVFGHRGRFSPDDIVNLAINHPAHAPFLCTKLWAYFTPRPLPKATLRQLVRAYVGSKTNVVPVLRIILNHPTLYADLDSPDQVKPPVVYAAGMLRRSGGRITKADWGYRLDEMGQQPFYPPNVSGWEMDEAWLSPGTIRARFDTASTLLGDSIQDGSIGPAQTPERALAAAMAATGSPPVSKRTMQALQRYSVSSVKGRSQAWEIKHYYPERQRVLRHLLLAGPEAQVS